MSGVQAAAVVCEPMEEFSTQPPLVMNTRSLSVRSMLRDVPSASVRSMRVAALRVGELNGLRGYAPYSACFLKIVSCPVPVRWRTGPMPPPIAKSTFSTFTL